MVVAQASKSVRIPAREHGNEGCGIGFGKVILLGEHAVVYGAHALAAPIALAISAQVVLVRADELELSIPQWSVPQHQYCATSDHSIDLLLNCILTQLHLKPNNIHLKVTANIPRAAGLGASAALAVALIRAFDYHYHLQLSDDEVNAVAFEAEKIAHGTPSGVDNTMATWGQMLLFRRGQEPLRRLLTIPKPISLVIGFTGQSGVTSELVSKVRARKEAQPELCERLFKEIDQLVLAATDAILVNNLVKLGQLMNDCQDLLIALQISTERLDELVRIARDNGALGAKLTGAGGGGAMIALCPDDAEQVITAMQAAGYKAMGVTIG